MARNNVIHIKKRSLVQASKFMSFILRHRPESIGLKLDLHGYAVVDDLVKLSRKSATSLTKELIQEVVQTSDKQRFRFSEDGLSIRASQGHSVAVDLSLTVQEPPLALFHGTTSRFLDSILRHGLKPGLRQHVHLSLDWHTAYKVGQRHGVPVVLSIRARDMYLAGFAFFLSENGVWLAQCVPPEFIRLADSTYA